MVYLRHYSRILTTYPSNNSFRFFLEIDLNTAERHFGENLRFSAILILLVFIVTRVHIFKFGSLSNLKNTNRSTTQTEHHLSY